MQVNEDVASSNLELDLKRALDLSNQIMGLMGSKDALETYWQYPSMEEPALQLLGNLFKIQNYVQE